MEICNHLRGVLDFEINRGNKINSSGDLWSEMNFAVHLEKPLDKEVIERNIKTEVFVKFHKNEDTHYLLQGFYCQQCKHAITSPLK